MAGYLISRSQAHSRKMQDHHLVQLGGVVLLQCGAFLATESNIERLWCPVGGSGTSPRGSQGRGAEP